MLHVPHSLFFIIYHLLFRVSSVPSGNGSERQFTNQVRILSFEREGERQRKSLRAENCVLINQITF
jgi:hypothetical protein